MTAIIGKQLLGYWELQLDLRVQLPALEGEIHDFEKSKNVMLPEDFTDYLLHANGFDQAEGYQDDNGFNFWPLEKIQPLSEIDEGEYFVSGHDGFFVFVDYLDFCWAYAIRLGSIRAKNEVAIVGTADGHPQIIANGFSDFARLYMERDFCLQPK